MDFSTLKEKFSSIKSDTLKFYNETVQKGATKLIESNFTIKTLFELEDFIGKSRNYFSESSNKEETKRIICIFASKESDFFKKFLYELPVIYTKAWARNIGIKLVESSLEGLDLLKYQIVSIPSLVLFENEKVVKVVATEEKINKIVKSLTLDIEKSIKDIDDTKKEVSPVSTNQSDNVVTSEIGGSDNIIKVEENVEVKTPEIPQNNTNNIINDSDIISEISK